MRNKMTNKGRASLIGIATITSLLMFYFGFNYLKGMRLFQDSNIYYVTFGDLQGVARSSKVNIKGYRVGNVREISFDYEQCQGATVALAVKRELKLPRETRATITANPLGGAIVTLVYPESTSGELLQDKDTIPGYNSPELMAQITEVLIPTLTHTARSLDSLMLNLNALVQSPEVRETLSEVRATARVLHTSADAIHRSICTDLPEILENVRKSTEEIQALAGKLNKIDLERMEGDLEQLLGDLKGFADQINRAEGSLGKLIHDPTLYQQLQSTIESAEGLVKDIKEHPKRYLHMSLF